MAYELTFFTGSGTCTAFLQEGFHSPGAPSGNLHRHTYPEIHAISGGEALFFIGSETFRFAEGDIFLIPPGCYHMCRTFSEGIIHTAFQTDAPLRTFSRAHMEPALLKAFLQEIRVNLKPGCCRKIQACLSLLYSHFTQDAPPLLRESSDHAFLIHEFFSHSYREEVSLPDLARQLHFSEKHTARLVQKHTGKTFTQALTAQRMAVAEHLAATTDMSLAEIAQYVGYRSYSGFWKAYKKRKNT